MLPNRFVREGNVTPLQYSCLEKFHGWRNLVGCSPWGCEDLDTTERLHFHALEKEMATHSSVLAWRIPGTGEPGGLPRVGVAQSQTRLKWLSSSSIIKLTYSSFGHVHLAVKSIRWISFFYFWPCRMAYGILFLWPEIEPMLLAVEAQS